VEHVVETPLSRQDTATEESQKWEDVPSVTSSFPSMSFPEHDEQASPRDHHVAPQPSPVSLTSAIFDTSLSRRTRLTAFFSSLAVNLLLPFVNGVMLGFGEIFAKNVLMDWLAHLKPRSVATAVGIRGSNREQRQTFSR
jgi:Outer membrane protein TOM13